MLSYKIYLILSSVSILATAKSNDAFGDTSSSLLVTPAGFVRPSTEDGSTTGAYGNDYDGVIKDKKEIRKFKKVISQPCEVYNEDTRGLKKKLSLNCDEDYKTREIKSSTKNGKSCSSSKCNSKENGNGNVSGVVDSTSPILRYRRSSLNDGRKKFENNFKFGEDFFTDGSYKIPVKYKTEAKDCEKVFRDSMVCMVCVNPETNVKYEQCSYVAQKPRGKYEQSAPNPPHRPEEKSELESLRDESTEYSDSLPVSRPHEDHYHEDYSTAPNKNVDCKEVRKDNQLCTICKDPKTGGDYEKCSYTFQPNDKVYKFSRSSSFGGPSFHPREEENAENPERRENFPTATTDSENYEEESRPSYEKSIFDETSSPYRSARPVIAAKSPKEEGDSDNDGCEQVKRDSMTCKVCKNKKTGDTSEKCSYAFEPNDKLFSYSRSSSFGSPTENKNDDRENSNENNTPQSTRRLDYVNFNYSKPYLEPIARSNPPNDFKEQDREDTEESLIQHFDSNKNNTDVKKFLQEFRKQDRSNCKRVIKDKMTCYKCTNEDGFQKEECMLVASQKPEKDRLRYREVKKFDLEPVKIPRPNRGTGSGQIKKRKAKSTIDSTGDASESDFRWKKKPVQRYHKRQIEEDETEDSDEQEKEATIKANLEVKKIKEKRTRLEGKDKNNTEKKIEEPEEEEFASETQLVYDKALGMSLPKYMLTPSEHEKEFDEAVASSSFHSH